MIFTDAAEINPTLTVDDLPGTYGGALGASAYSALYNSPTAQIARTLEDMNAGGPMLDYETARSKSKAAGVDIQIDPQGMSEGALNLLIERKRSVAKANDAISRGPHGFWAGSSYFLGGLGAAMLDPINIASAFIPVARGIGMANTVREAGMLGEAGAAVTAAARFSARARVGAVEGGVGQAILEPLTAYRASQEQEDYGITDTLLNVGFGTVLGAVAHTGLGALGDRAVASERATKASKLIESAKTAPDRAVNYDVPAVWRKDSAAAKLQAADMETVATTMKAEVVAAVEGRKFDSSVLVGEKPKSESPFQSADVQNSLAAGDLAGAQRALDNKITETGPQTKEVTLKDGTKAKLEFSPKDENGNHRIRAVDSEGNVIGGITPVFDVRPGESFSDSEVAAAFRRKGLATEMYNFAEEISGVKLSESGVASPDAKAFWENRRAAAETAQREQAAPVDPTKVQSAAAASHLPENDVHYDAKAKAEVDEAVKMQGEAVDPAEAVTRATQEAQAELATLSQQLGIDPEKNAAMRSADELAATASRYSKAIEAFASCQVRS